MRIRITGMLLSILIMAASAQAAIGEFAGETATRGERFPLPAAGRDFELLWDTSHGVHNMDEPSGYFYSLVAMLAGEGFRTTVISDGLLNHDLGAFDVIVFCTGSAWDSYYTPAEADAVAAYVEAGGAVLIMAETTGCHNINLYFIALAFGVSLGLEDVWRDYITDFIDHDIFDGVSSVRMGYGGAIAAVAPSIDAAWVDTGETMICLYPDCRVVVVGDSTLWTNVWLDFSDNRRLALNVFTVLAECEPPTAAKDATWSTLKSLYCSAATAQR